MPHNLKVKIQQLASNKYNEYFQISLLLYFNFEKKTIETKKTDFDLLSIW